MTTLEKFDKIENHIYTIRATRVMLSTDIARLYGVKPKALIQAVKRNKNRFPIDFMFQLSFQEVSSLRSQFVTANWSKIRTPPYAFTEQGIAMLSSVLTSERAVMVNIEIMRAFVNLKKYIATYKELSDRLNQLENKYDENFKIVFDAIRELMTPPENPKRKIGIIHD